MQNRVYGNQYRTTIVCIDSYDNKVLSGRMYNPYLSEGKQFQSLIQFLLEMEKLLDSMHFPQSFTAVRTFAPAIKPPSDAVSDDAPKKGKLATFHVQVIFRQNASYQGSVTWLEEERESSFRSVLELVLLMNSALE